MDVWERSIAEMQLLVLNVTAKMKTCFIVRANRKIKQLSISAISREGLNVKKNCKYGLCCVQLNA